MLAHSGSNRSSSNSKIEAGLLVAVNPSPRPLLLLLQRLLLRIEACQVQNNSRDCRSLARRQLLRPSRLFQLLLLLLRGSVQVRLPLR